MPQAHATHGGKFFDAIGSRLDHLERHETIINADVLDAWYDPAPGVLQSISANLSWLIKTSPPTHADGLRDVIAGSRGIDPAQVLIGAGTSSLIFTVFPGLFGGKNVGILDPTYGEYPHVLGLNGATVSRLGLEAPAFKPTVTQVIDFSEGLDGLVLVNPNSPTGVGLPFSDIRAILSTISPKTTVWIDETYIDFMAGSQSAERLVAEFPNLIVCKSMSKFYGLSGLRIGYLVANPAVVSRFESMVPPWAAGMIGQLAAIEALGDPAYYEARRVETLTLARDLAAGLSGLDFEVTASDANFLLMKTTNLGAAELCARCEAEGLFLRNCDSLSEQFQDKYVRTAVKSKAVNERILEIIGNALR